MKLQLLAVLLFFGSMANACMRGQVQIPRTICTEFRGKEYCIVVGYDCDGPVGPIREAPKTPPFSTEVQKPDLFKKENV